MILDINNFEVRCLKYCYNGNINSSQMATKFHYPFSTFEKPKSVINTCFQIEAILRTTKGNVLHLLVRLISVFQR